MTIPAWLFVLWVIVELLWLLLGPSKQTRHRCACGASRAAVSADPRIVVHARTCVHECRRCGALYTRSLYGEP